MADIKYIIYSDPDFLLVKNMRTAVFVNEQGIDINKEFDTLDEKSTFALLFEDGKAVATSRVTELDGKIKIGRIAVLKEYRGKHFGEVTVNAILKKAFEYNTSKVYVDAQNYAVPFYKKLGFAVCGEELVDRGIVHTPMCIDKGDFNG